MRIRHVAILCLLSACGGGGAAIKTASQPKPPAWMTKATGTADSLFFTGAKEGASSLEDGKTSALEAARSQAAQYIGVTISAEHTDVMSTVEADNHARDQVNSRAQALIRGAELADEYHEKISREVGSGTIDRYDVWVLLKLPRAEVQKERERQAEEAKVAVKSSLARFREGQAQEKAGNVFAALVRYRDVVAQLKGTGTSVETGDGDLPSAGRLRQAAEDAASSTQGKARRALLIAPDSVAGAVTKALASKGFSARAVSDPDEEKALASAKAQGMPWVIVVRATTTPGGHVFNQVAASASLDVRALDSQSGATVASSQKQAKGMGRTPEAAQQAAASEAGLSAANELAAALMAKENAGL